ncbi:MAG: hypothetical protein N2746_06570 [Deltaproteobacteria bacterium]|nr:hypothetical protein [Deltaproteobacteria bacterium]
MLAKCSHCGGEITTEIDNVFVTCNYCKASVFVFSKSSGLRYILKPILSENKTDLVIKNFFLKKGYSGEIKILTKEAVLYPFYRINNKNELVPAREDSNFGILSQIKFKGGELIFFDDKKNLGYKIVEPEVEPNELTGKNANLIYYPLIFVEYSYLGEEYKLVIDGFSEEVYSEIMPIQKDNIRERVYIYIFIIIAFLLFIEFISFDSLIIGFILGIITLLIIWFFFPTIFRLIEDIYVSEDKDNKMS